MALLYPWATKEYLLWEMSIGQVFLYHNLGVEMRYGRREKAGKKTLRGASHAELKAAQAEARRQLGLREGEDVKAKLREKYGDVD